MYRPKPELQEGHYVTPAVQERKWCSKRVPYLSGNCVEHRYPL